MQIQFTKVSDLIPYIKNSRTHDDAQIAQIASSIKEFGWTNPILVDGDNGIIAGHGRLMAARKLGMDEVPTIELTGMTDLQKKAYIIADNKLALNAGWDNELLGIELTELGDARFDLDLTGFSVDEISSLSLEGLAEMPFMSDGEKPTFQQKTFTLHDEQASIVDDALTLARTNPLSDTGLNDNTNGNALALICKEWLENGHG